MLDALLPVFLSSSFFSQTKTMKSRQQNLYQNRLIMPASTRPLSAFRRRACYGARAGFSLLEVLVVLVVLLIGILSILQLFPGGFLVIARTAEQTMAVQLAGQQLDAQRALSVQPDYIVPGLPDKSGNIHEISSIRPDDTTQETDTSIADYSSGSKSNPADVFTLPDNYPGYFFSDINRLRYIKGETLHVPVANPNIKNNNYQPIGSFYTLQFGPAYNFFNSDTTQNPNGCSVKVYGAALARTIQSSIATLDQPDSRALLQNDNQYAIDYVNHRIAFFPRVGKTGAARSRTFNITLDYYNTSSNPPVLMHLSGSIPVPDLDATLVASGVAPQAVWQEIFLAANFPGMTLPSVTDQSNIRSESEDVSRQFKLITIDSTGAAVSPPTFIGAANGPQWSDDPYEYAWYSAQQGSLNANPGTLLFNPSGHLSFAVNSNVSDTQTQIAGQAYANAQALVARIDYLVYDNHIIRDQRTMPSGGPYTVKLTLPNVLTNGDLLDDASTFNGIFQGSSTGTSDVLVIDANDGTELCEIQQGAATGSSILGVDALDATAGTITFKTTYMDPNNSNIRGVEDLNLQGRPLRILYRTQKNWGQQVQKASSVYAPVSASAQVTYTTYFVGDGTGGSSKTRIYFAPSESGKTVNIGEFYLMTATGSIFAPFKNETFQIQDDRAQYDAVGLPFIDITTTHINSDSEHLANGATGPEPITGFTAKPTGRAINSVRGLSIKSRVMWKSSSRFRTIDQDSILPTDRL